MAYDENGNYIPDKNDNPTYHNPTEQPAYMDYVEQLLAGAQGPAGWQDVVAQVRDYINQPQGFRGKLPWSDEQITTFAGNQILGGQAARKAAELNSTMKSGANRTFKRMYNNETAGLARSGLKGSSTEAALLAEGTGRYRDTLDNIDLGTANYEEQLRNAAFGRGMGVLGAFENVTRGDDQLALEQAAALQSSLGPEFQVNAQSQAILQTLLGNEFNSVMAMNAYEQEQYLAKLAKTHGGGFANFIGQLLGAGATVAAASIGAGA